MSRWPIPKEWRWVKAADIATIVGGGTPSTKNPENFTENGISWITPADLSNYQDEYISRGMRDLSEEGYNSCGAQLMPKDTVLFTSRAPVGYCALAANEICTNQGFKSLVLRGGINPEYIRHYLLYSKEYAESLASGSTFKELSGKRMATLEFPIPPLNEQKRIVAKIEDLEARSRRAREALETIPDLLEQLRQSILAAAFRGDLTKEWREERSLPAPRPGAFFAYVLKCADDSNYIGITENLQRRWEEHKSGKGGRWTKQNPPHYVLHWEEHLSRQAAAKREKWLKTGFGRKWLKREEKAGRLMQAGNVEPASELLKRISIERRKRWEAAELEKLKAKGLTGDKLEDQFAKRRKQYKEPDPVDTTDLPELPEGWIWISGEYAVPVDAPIVYGIILPGPHIDGGVPYIRPLEIQNDVIVDEPIPRTSPEIATKYDRAKLAVGDIILSIVGTIGKVAVVPKRLNGANITQSSARLRPWLDFITLEYLAEVLRSPSLRSQYDKFRFGNAVQRLNIAHVRSLAIPLPAVDEQKEITKTIQQKAICSSAVLSAVETSLERLDDLSNAVFAKAFRGELVPQDPNDEPALILLERIRQEKARQEAEQKAKPKQRGKKMKRQKIKQKDILTILQDSASAMTPEELFAAGGFDEDSVDAFYEQLRSAVTAKKVCEKRKGDEVRLEAIP